MVSTRKTENGGSSTRTANDSLCTQILNGGQRSALIGVWQFCGFEHLTRSLSRSLSLGLLVFLVLPFAVALVSYSARQGLQLDLPVVLLPDTSMYLVFLLKAHS